MKNSCKRDTFFSTISVIANEVLPFLFFILVLFGFDDIYISVFTLISALIHELGHIFAGYIILGKINLPKAQFFGFKIKNEGCLSYKNEISILLSGPLANLLVFLILLPFLKLGGAFLYDFAFINLLTAISNLLPSEGYDGYSALEKAFFAFGLLGAEKHLQYISLFTSSVISLLSLFFIWFCDLGYWIFIVFFLSLISKISKLLKYRIFEN